MKRYCSLYILFILMLSCNERKKISFDDVLEIRASEIRTEEKVFPEDSILVINPVAIRKPTKVNAGQPTITPAFTNILQAGEPTIQKAGAPDTITSSINGNKLPETTAAIIRKNPARNRRFKKAMPPGIINGTNNIFEYLDIEQGLASGNILTIFQDKKGNFWLGTNGEGIIKYDGVNFLQFTDKDGIPSNWVRCILEDKKGNMWFGTDGGIVKYNGFDFYWIIEHVDSSEHSNRLDTRSMAEDKNGNIWVGTANFGLYKFDGKSFTHYLVNNTLGRTITDIAFDKNENLWFSGTNIGVCRYDGNSFIQYKKSDGLIDDRVNCITADAAGNMWFGTEQGVSKFFKNTFYNISDKQGLCDNNINSITEDKSGNIWFGTNYNGCCRYDGKSFSNFNLTEGLRSNYVGCIVLDNAGNLLFGTRGGGVIIMKYNNFLTFGRQSAINQTNVTSINEDNDGNTWLGTLNGSVIKFDGHNFYDYADKAGLNGGPVNSIIKDKKGNMWFGGLRGGLCKFDGTVFTRYSDKFNASLSQITELHEDKNGTIWIGTNTNKILKFDGTEISGFSLGSPKKKNVVWSILEDKNGLIWIGTHDGLLANYDGKSFRYYQFKKNPLYNIQQDSAGNIWLASSTDGLLKFDTKFKNNTGQDKIFLNFNKISDQYNVRINSLLKDKKENLWIGTNKGLILFENPSAKPINSPRMLNITQKDGLPGEAFVRTSVFMDAKDRIWWGTTKGLCMLDLHKMQLDTFTPTIQLNHITNKGKFVDFHQLYDSGIQDPRTPDFNKIKYAEAQNFYNYPINPKFPYSLNHLTFNFIATDWASPQRLKYRYKMDGFDYEWSELTEENYADYRNIPYGNYTFRVKAIGAAQKWSAEFVYPFTILPPWWHTWWFRSLLFLAFVLGIYSFIKYRTSSLLKRQEFLQSTVEKRTEELRIALSDKEALLKEIHHRVKNNLEVISSLLTMQTKVLTDDGAKAALAESQSRVQSIALIHHKLYSGDEMGSVELCGFSKDLFKQVKDVFNKPGIPVDLRINESEIWLHTDAAVPFGLILNELITNTFKYAVQENKENIITIYTKETHEANSSIFHFTFRDNGPGLPDAFNAASAPSLGMKVIRLLTRQLEGTSQFYNDNGAVFELQFSKKEY